MWISLILVYLLYVFPYYINRHLYTNTYMYVHEFSFNFSSIKQASTMCMKVNEVNTMLDICPLVSRNMQPTRCIYLAHSSTSMNKYVMTIIRKSPSVRILLLYINYLCLLLSQSFEDKISSLTCGIEVIKWKLVHPCLPKTAS